MELSRSSQSGDSEEDTAFVLRQLLRHLYTREIAAGEELSICYADILLPTSIRQEIFLTTKHFECHCDRCRWLPKLFWIEAHMRSPPEEPHLA